MAEQYYPPSYLKNNFHCLRCGVYARQNWSTLEADGVRLVKGGPAPVQVLSTGAIFRGDLPNNYVVSSCAHCSDFTLWYDKQIIFPRQSGIENANSDLNEEITAQYNEAALILHDSPRAAAALLRLALQLLLRELGGKGKSIDADIKTIVASGVDPQVQKAMDIVRVFGNNAAHPGEIQLKEDPEMVKKMFELINFIATKMITQQKEIDSLFDDLPEGAKQAIAKRDQSEVNNG